MKKGIKAIKTLSEDERTKILTDIVAMCIREAGDSYSECGRSITKYLKKLELVDYGD